MGFEENEISINASGGTELTKRLLQSSLPSDLLDNFQIISSRIRELDEDKIRVLFLHDLPQDPESAKLADPAYRDKFHKFVFVSEWQYAQYQTVLGFPYDLKSIVLENCIVPIENHEKPRDKIRLAYFSTPHRGLDILVPVFKELAKRYPNIHLDVFSSFKIYGWEDADKQFEPLFEECRNHPQITYHGSVPNDELRSHLKQSHILAYPSTWIETSCRVIMESMSAGMLCVHPNYGALPMTGAGLTFMYPGDTDKNKHAQQFYGALEEAVKLMDTNEESLQAHLKFAKMYADGRFNDKKVTAGWEATLRQLLRQYPDAEQRKFPKELFVYKPS